MAGRTCTVGLTGGLASGKSAVARMLSERGAAVIDADAVVHELYRPGGAGAGAVARLFGPDLLDREGSVDRLRLGQLVLADPAARARLEAAVHPLVRERIARWLVSLLEREPPPPVAVVEAALLVETGSFRDYGLLVVVWCRPAQQLERAVGRGVAEDRARAVLAAQLPLDDKRRLADVVIDNSGPLEGLAGEVERAWRGLLERCARR